MADRLAGHHRGCRRADAGRSRRDVRAARQSRADGAAHRRSGGGCVGRRLVDCRGHFHIGQTRRARRQDRRDRADDLRAACGAHGELGRHHQSQPPLYAAAPGQVGGGNRLAADRRRPDRSRHDGAARQPAAGPERTRSRRHRRACLHRARRHQRHPFLRRYADDRSRSRRADAIRRRSAGLHE